MPDFFNVGFCRGCNQYYPEQMLTAGLCDRCDWDGDIDEDDDEYDRLLPNGTNCPQCGDDLVQVQNGDWVCPDCDLWL